MSMPTLSFITDMRASASASASLRRSIRFSSSCIRTSQTPVIYVFGRKPIDVSNCVTELTNSIRDSSRACSAECVVLRCDVVYSHKATEIAERLYVTLGRPVHHRKIPLKAEPLGQPPRSVGENQRLGATDQAAEDILLYIGPESLSLTNLLVTHGSSEVPTFLFITMQRTKLWVQGTRL